MSERPFGLMPPASAEAQLELDLALAQSALERVEALCAEWDAMTKGPSPTTDRIREAIAGV